MINVAFLLLIFFLMVAVIAPPDPFEVELPAGEGEAGDGGLVTLTLTRDGLLARHGVVNDAPLAGIEGMPVFLRADASVTGAQLNTLLIQLAEAGSTSVHLALSGR